VRRRVVWLITFAGGLYFLLEFLLPEQAPAWLGGFKNPLTPYLTDATNFIVVVGTMAFLLGPFNLLRGHLGTLLRLRKGWFESAVFVVFLVISIVAAADRPDEGKSGAGFAHLAGLVYNALFYGVLTAFFASSMALLAFYLVSAAHRAFRVNSVETGLMMASATVILLGQVPLGDWMTQGLPKFLQFPTMAQWILAVPNTAVQRAVLIGACGGAFATGVRLWLGIGKRQD